MSRAAFFHMPRPVPPTGGWAPESATPYVDGLPLMAWASWQMQMRGFDQEHPMAALVVFAVRAARDTADPDERAMFVQAIQAGVRAMPSALAMEGS